MLEQEKPDQSRRAAASAPPSQQPSQTSAANSASVHEATGSAGEKAPRPSSRVDWATLLRRVYTIDALECPACKGRMRFTDLFEDKTAAREELERRGMPTEPPPLARARSPDPAFG